MLFKDLLSKVLDIRSRLGHAEDTGQETPENDLPLLTQVVAG